MEFIARRRAGGSATGAADYRINAARPVRDAPWVAAFFFVTALVVAGLPPGSGFIAKVLLLDAAAPEGIDAGVLANGQLLDL